MRHAHENQPPNGSVFQPLSNNTDISVTLPISNQLSGEVRSCTGTKNPKKMFLKKMLKVNNTLAVKQQVSV